MCATEATLELRAAKRAASLAEEASKTRAAAQSYGQRLATALMPPRANKCRVYYCDACGTVFPETEAVEAHSGYLRCPDCGMDVA